MIDSSRWLHDCVPLSRSKLYAVMFLLVAGGVLIYVFREGVAAIWASWGREEYSHGPMIPLVAAWLVFQKMPSLVALPAVIHWPGAVIVGLALGGWVLGELSSLYIILQYAFLLGFYGLVVGLLGWPRSKTIWAALIYLVFIIPLPNFLYANLSQQLQLVSSMLGVEFIRWFDISVFLEGNVIDLGVYKLQVVEACSGLNYLFPLMSFGFLLAYLYTGAPWQRIIIFASTLPITILMNSLRIGAVGVMVEYYGIDAADGFLHYFEGWLIFMVCVGLLLLEIKVFAVFSSQRPAPDQRREFSDFIDLSWPGIDFIRKNLHSFLQVRSPLWVSLIMLIAFIPLSFVLEKRVETTLPRQEFVSFPLFHKTWVGRQDSIAPDVVASLQLTDYFLAEYHDSGAEAPITLYAAYYGSQRKGASVHSPRSCMPAGGWEIQSLGQVKMPGQGAATGPEVNRVVIHRGGAQQLVYYWFQQRGRVVTNEYLAKWYIFWDAITRNRTDGSLIRIAMPVFEATDMAVAEIQLRQFVEDFSPLFSSYIPD